MPDSRRHRSAAPPDRALFARERLAALREAVAHFSWLLSHGYGEVSALKIVGDRFDLASRAREAVLRSSCADDARAVRREKEVDETQLGGEKLWIDGYNVLTTVESALGGGVILAARDGCLRDLASVHGTWRKVEETVPAIELCGAFLERQGLSEITWVFDKPVSNSARLKQLLARTAEMRGWEWELALSPNADKTLIESGAVVASADRVVLERCARWFNLARSVVTAHAPSAWILHLGDAELSAG